MTIIIHSYLAYNTSTFPKLCYKLELEIGQELLWNET